MQNGNDSSKESGPKSQVKMVGGPPKGRAVRDFKLLRLLPLVEHEIAAPLSLRTEQFKSIVETYDRNLDRFRGAFDMPTLVAGLTADRQRCFDLALVEETGSLDSLLGLHDPRLPKILERASQHFIRNIKERQERKEATVYIEEGIVHLLENVVSDTDPVARGISSMFYTQIVAAWTAFETLAGDLWETALNVHPETLASLKGKRRNRYHPNGEGEMADEDDERAESEKSVKLGLLQRYGYDVSNKMGTILRERFKFERLSGIREAYWTAFSRSYTEIDESLSNLALDAVSVVRNVIVHKSGVADREYTRRAKGLQNVPLVKSGEPLVFDGESVEALLAPMLDCANALIYAADRWVTPLP